ncbi:HNH nuclease [Vibrio phage 1.256.O._10N.286.45.F8]|nr:HNH nuclease [Vibrio phage 1.256.O._10N.286.45.F8]
MTTQNHLKECLHYDTESGVFTWIERPDSHFSSVRVSRSWRGRNVGKVAGSILKDGSGKKYISISVDGVLYLAHRLAFIYVQGEINSELEVDHIDGNGMNNSWANLRLVTSYDNAKNHRRVKTNTSGVTGVTWHKKRKVWCARIGFNGVRVNLGEFKDFNLAISARKRAEKDIGYHENHGTVRDL